MNQALALGKPVVVAEYHMDSSSDVAKRYGDIACQMGAIGTGNGRNVEQCGQAPKEKEKWYQRYEREMVVSGVALATLFAVSRFDLPIMLNATEESYQIGTKKKVGNHTFGMEYSDSGWVLALYRFDF